MNVTICSQSQRNSAFCTEEATEQSQFQVYQPINASPEKKKVLPLSL